MSSGKNHKTRCSLITRRPPPQAAQGGFAFMVVLVGLVLGSLTIFLENLNHSVSSTRQADKTREALAEAKEILIAWAAESEIDNNGPGHLPCPDNDNNGHGEGAACGPESRLGRFPWKTLNAPDLRDASNERLWYAVSPNFLNKPSNPVNSDTKGLFRVTGATEQDGVIAIIFAPGPALAGQERGTTAAQIDVANYLEEPNPGDNQFRSEYGGLNGNDRMVFVTASDLYAAVDRKVAERMQTNIVPLLHYYLQQWVAANDDAADIALAEALAVSLEASSRLLPFAAPFAPSSAAQCGEDNLSRGQLPLGYCGTWGGVFWDKESGQCEELTSNLPPGSMAALRCTVVISAGSDDDDDCDDDDDDGEESSYVTRSVRFNVLLNGAGRRTLVMPLDDTRVLHTNQALPQSFKVHSARLNGGDIGFRYDAKYKVDRCASPSNRTTTIVLPVYRVDKQYVYKRTAEIDADSSLTQEQKVRKKKQIDPEWYFGNGWHRHTYYAVSAAKAPCTSCATTLSVQHPHTDHLSSHDALLILAGRAVYYLDEGGQKRLQSRPSDQLPNYFERKNKDADQPLFQSADPLRGVNDQVVSVCPWTPNPYQPDSTQTCP